MTSAPQPAEAPAEAPAPAPARRRRGLVLAAAALVVLGGGGGTAAWFLRPWAAAGGKAPAALVEEPVRGFAPLGAVVVNVGGLETRRYARVGVELGVASPKDAKHVEEFKASLLDLLISEVAATPVERLASSEGRARLKQDLLARIQGELGLREVRRVYFTEFMIQ